MFYSRRWEHFAGEVKRTYGNEHIHIGTVNCVTYQALCYQHKITGYPTIRIFRQEARFFFSLSLSLNTVISLVWSKPGHGSGILQRRE